MSLIADTGIVNRSGPNIFVEVDHEIFAIAILLLLVIQEGQYVSYKRKRVHNVLPSLSLPRKSVVRFSDHLDMAMTID